MAHYVFIFFKFWIIIIPAKTQDTHHRSPQRTRFTQTKSLSHSLSYFANTTPQANTQRLTHTNKLLTTHPTCPYPITSPQTNASALLVVSPYQLQNDTTLRKYVKRMEMIRSRAADHPLPVVAGAFHGSAPKPYLNFAEQMSWKYVPKANTQAIIWSFAKCVHQRALRDREGGWLCITKSYDISAVVFCVCVCICGVVCVAGSKRRNVGLLHCVYVCLHKRILLKQHLVWERVC